MVHSRAYVVHAQRLGKQEREVFASRVGEWIKGRVARHKYLRGGQPDFLDAEIC